MHWNLHHTNVSIETVVQRMLTLQNTVNMILYKHLAHLDTSPILMQGLKYPLRNQKPRHLIDWMRYTHKYFLTTVISQPMVSEFSPGFNQGIRCVMNYLFLPHLWKHVETTPLRHVHIRKMVIMNLLMEIDHHAIDALPSLCKCLIGQNFTRKVRVKA